MTTPPGNTHETEFASECFEYTGVEVLEAMAEAKNYSDYLVQILRTAFPKSGGSVLDFGAGVGTYADMLMQDGITVSCLEPDEKLQRILREKGYETCANDADLTESSYDLIYALNVFEHIEDDYQAFARACDALRPGGVLVIYVPAFPSLYSSFDKLVGHYRRYRKPRLRDMAGQNGLHIVRLDYCDPLGYLAALAFKARRSRTGDLTARGIKLYDRVLFPISMALEPLFARAVGKNVVLVARRPA